MIGRRCRRGDAHSRAVLIGREPWPYPFSRRMADLLPLFFSLYCDNYAGGHGGADIPVPVPNTEVKRPSADGTASRRESRPPPAFSFFSSLRPGRAFRARRACFFPLPPLCRLSPRPPRRRLRRFPAGGAGRHLLLLRGERFLMSCGASAEKSQGAVRPPPPGNLPGPSRTNCSPLSPRPRSGSARFGGAASLGTAAAPEAFRSAAEEWNAQPRTARPGEGDAPIKRQIPFRQALIHARCRLQAVFPLA